MRKVILELTPSLTASVKTQVLCMKLQEEEENIKYYFVEYPTNLPPNHYMLHSKGNVVTEIEKETYEVIFNCFNTFVDLTKKYPYLHAPTFILSYCIGQGVNVEELGILS